MIKSDDDEQTFYVQRSRHATDAEFEAEVAYLDATLARVAPGELRWFAPGVTELGPAPVRGVGDLVKKLTDAVGIPTCGGCEKRRQWLNKHFPIG